MLLQPIYLDEEFYLTLKPTGLPAVVGPIADLAVDSSKENALVVLGIFFHVVDVSSSLSLHIADNALVSAPPAIFEKCDDGTVRSRPFLAKSGKLIYYRYTPIKNYRMAVTKLRLGYVPELMESEHDCDHVRLQYCVRRLMKYMRLFALVSRIEARRRYGGTVHAHWSIVSSEIVA